MSSPEDGDAPETEEVPEVGFDVKERAMDEAPVGITITDPTRQDNPLVYINDAFERVTGYPREEVLGRNCRFLQGEATDAEAVAELARGVREEETVQVELLNYREDGESFWNEIKIAPLENEDGEVTHFVGFQKDVTERKRAQMELREERENLDLLLSRIQGVIADVTAAVVTAATEDEVAQRVCDRMAEVDVYDFAWVGRVDLAGDRIQPTAWSGRQRVDADALAVDLNDDDHPVTRALDTGDIQVSEDPATALGGVDTDGGVTATVPLAYRGTTYGALTVHAPDLDSLNEREMAVLEALGRTIATALNAHESKRMLSADSIVEIELEVRDPGLFFVDISDRLDCTLEYRGAAYREDAPTMFFTTDVDPTDVIEAATGFDGIAYAGVVGEESESDLIEFRFTAESVVGELADRGVRTRAIEATNGQGRIKIELPAGGDARSVVEQFRDRYPRTELVSYRENERPPTTEQEFIAGLESDLTDRQLTALQRAYFSGYYDANRSVSGDELAESMDLSRSTFHQHLRAAERKVLRAFFER